MDSSPDTFEGSPNAGKTLRDSRRRRTGALLHKKTRIATKEGEWGKDRFKQQNIRFKIKISHSIYGIDAIASSIDRACQQEKRMQIS